MVLSFIFIAMEPRMGYVRGEIPSIPCVDQEYQFGLLIPQTWPFKLMEIDVSLSGTF